MMLHDSDSNNDDDDAFNNDSDRLNWRFNISCSVVFDNIAGLLQERRNSIANALELRFSCSDSSIYYSGSFVLNQFWKAFQSKKYHIMT